MLTVLRVVGFPHEPLPGVTQHRGKDSLVANACPPVVVGVFGSTDRIHLSQTHERITRNKIHPQLPTIVLPTPFRLLL